MAASMGVASQFPVSGVVTTPVLDLGDVPTSAPVANLGGDVPAGTGVEVVASRSSDDGITWSDWTASGDDWHTLTAPLAQRWQLQIRLSTTSTLLTPELTLLVVHADKTSASLSAGFDWNYGGRWSDE